MSLKTAVLVAVTALSLLIASPAKAACSAPSGAGLRICFPTQGSTVMYVPALEMAATARSGAIVRAQVYDNGRLVDDFSFLPSRLIDGAMKNGPHTVTVKTWDSAGNVLQATRTFTVAGYGVGTCSRPSGPGVNLCWPLSNSWQPNTSVPISATGRGSNSNIKSLSIFVDGKFLVGASGASILTGAGVTAGRHRVAAVATDYAGHTYKTVQYFNAYYNYDCNPRSGVCTPGIVLNSPGDLDVPTSFRVQADVVNNPQPITSMTVYLDGNAVATSGGPGITAQLNLAAKTTHILWVKAKDTAGKMYETYQTLFVQ